jgi:TonB family protein
MHIQQTLRFGLGMILVLGTPILAHGRVSDADLRQEFGNKTLTLRRFYSGNHLHFDAAGQSTAGASAGAWTVDGQLRVDNISLSDGVVHIQGQRLFLFYDPHTQQLRAVDTITKHDDARKLFRGGMDKWSAKNGKIEVDVECGVDEPEINDVLRAMNAVFLESDEYLASVVPDFWQGWVGTHATQEKVSNATTNPQEPVARVGGHVSPPRVIFSPDPKYRDLAQKSGYEAVVVLWLVVDRNGLPQDIKVARPAGMGLDEQAVEAVRTWKFEPGKKDGLPVAVQINVEVQFRLY